MIGCVELSLWKVANAPATPAGRATARYHLGQAEEGVKQLRRGLPNLHPGTQRAVARMIADYEAQIKRAKGKLQ